MAAPGGPGHSRTDQPSTDTRGIDPARAFCLLGLWQGPSISSAAAAALFGVPEHGSQDALEVLVDTHLLESVAPDRYRFHDLLRVYAAGRAAADLPAAERDAAVVRLLTWYVRTADAAASAVAPHRYNMPLDVTDADALPPGFTGAEDALSWYDGERANIVAATRQASAAGRHEIAWRLPAPLYLIFNSRGNWADCIATHLAVWIAHTWPRAAAGAPRGGDAAGLGRPVAAGLRLRERSQRHRLWTTRPTAPSSSTPPAHLNVSPSCSAWARTCWLPLFVPLTVRVRGVCRLHFVPASHVELRRKHSARGQDRRRDS